MRASQEKTGEWWCKHRTQGGLVPSKGGAALAIILMYYVCAVGQEGAPGRMPSVAVGLVIYATHTWQRTNTYQYTHAHR